MNLDQELDQLIATLPQVAAQKRYWLIRTQSGSLYETFRSNNFIAIEHNEIPLSRLNEFYNSAAGNETMLLSLIRKEIRDVKGRQLLMSEEEELDANLKRSAGRTASQIYRFVYKVKKGDIVIIPSESSDVVSFGEVKESYIGEFTDEELRRMETEYILKKRVVWKEDVLRKDLDPYIYRLFMSQQAVNDVSSYAKIIERSLNDFFIIDEEAHVILNVKTEDDIPAKSLFGLGTEILELVDQFAHYYSLDINSSDLQVSLNLNSPGKIDLKSKIKKTTLVTGLILLVAGGGYKSASGTLNTEGLPGIIKAVDDFLNHQKDRDVKQQEIDLKQQMFTRYKDSLHVENPDDLIKLMKQVSNNKDLPKSD